MSCAKELIGGKNLPMDSEIARRLAQVLKPRGECSPECVYLQPRLEVHVHGERWSLASPFGRAEGVNAISMHHRVRTIYVCPKHLRVHHCCPSCPTILNKDRVHTCPISGVCWDDTVEITRSWRTSSRVEAAQHGDKSDPLKHARDHDGRLGKMYAHNVRDTGRLKAARITLHRLFFSRTRILHEIESHRLARKAAMKRVARYSRQCVREGKPRNLSTMQRIFSSECSLRGHYLHRLSRYSAQSDFVRELALDAVSVYRRLAEKGLSCPFDAFTVAVVYLMRRGLKCGVRARPSLNLMLPPANSLHRFFHADLNFTQTKNMITLAMRS